MAMKERNYITPRGLERIRLELEWLDRTERPKVVAEVSYAASLGDRSENAEYIYGKKKLRQIDSRRTYLTKRLGGGQLVDPLSINDTRVRFGATVILENDEGEEIMWRIYGEDEVDIARRVLSWKSPLARALQGKEAGETIVFKAPGGTREFELLEVRYDAQDPIEEVEWRTARYARG
jgi:transcription elongation factor GreB